MNRSSPRRAIRPAAPGAALLLALLAGCASPLQQPDEPELRRAILQTAQRERLYADQYPSVRAMDRADRVVALGIRPEIMTELNRSSGPASYTDKPIYLAADLAGQPQQAVRISLQRAILTAAENNLRVQFARLAPAASEAQTEAARGAFDYVLFASSSYQVIDRPQIRSGTFGVPQINTDTLSLTGGVRRRLTTGGQVSLQQGYQYSENSTPNSTTLPDPAHTANLSLEIQQPLLRGFGSDIALAEVRLAQNAERDQLAQLRSTLIQQVAQVEQTYWDLVGSYNQLLIAQRLLERGVEVRDTLGKRMETARDVRPSQYSDAVATVENRRTFLLQAELQLRQTSDQLKQLMNDPNLTIGSEYLILPVDNAPDAPLNISLADAIATAINNRPEVSRGLLAIDDASIRQTVADNLRLPRLDMQAQVQFNALAGEFGNSLDDQFDGRFVDWLIGLQAEQPIGNRSAEAGYRQRRIERMQAVITYRDVVQRVLGELKTAMRQADTNYKLIEQTRAARIAAAENLRTLEVEERTIQALTPEFLNLKFDRQQRLASAEANEIQALTNYSTAVAQVYAAMGVALERNKIALAVPTMYEAAGSPPPVQPEGDRPPAPVDAQTIAAPQAEPKPRDFPSPPLTPDSVPPAPLPPSNP